MPTETAILIGGAIAAALLVWGIARLVTDLIPSVQSRAHKRLIGGARADLQATDAISILRKRPDSFRAQQFPKMAQFEQRLQAVMPDTSLARFAFICVALGFVCGGLASYVAGPFPAGLILLGVGVAAPVLVVNAMRAKRERVLSDELIDALDFLARVLRAGHSLATALQMCSEELPQPIADEFRQCHEQLSLGRSMEEALLAMAIRMDLTDFNFFVTSVMIQRQTGGDLAEILDNIAKMIRNRIRLQQQVKALTSEGRATGWVLAALPVGMFIVMSIMNPNYVSLLLNDPTGRMMLGSSAGLLVLGLVIIKRIVTIKV